jgi:hypothetical protein
MFAIIDFMTVIPAGYMPERQVLKLPGVLGELFSPGLFLDSCLLLEGPGGLSYVGLQLLSEASSINKWCAIAGIADISLASAADLGASLDHIVSVNEKDLTNAVSLLIESFDVILLNVACVNDIERLKKKAKKHKTILALINSPKPTGFDYRISIIASNWHGLSQGWGHLSARTLTLSVTARRPFLNTKTVSVSIPSKNSVF